MKSSEIGGKDLGQQQWIFGSAAMESGSAAIHPGNQYILEIIHFSKMWRVWIATDYQISSYGSIRHQNRWDPALVLLYHRTESPFLNGKLQILCFRALSDLKSHVSAFVGANQRAVRTDIASMIS